MNTTGANIVERESIDNEVPRARENALNINPLFVQLCRSFHITSKNDTFINSIHLSSKKGIFSNSIRQYPTIFSEMKEITTEKNRGKEIIF